MKRIVLSLSVLLFASFSFAQTVKKCGTMEAMENYLKAHPEEAEQLKKNQAELELHANDPISSNKTQAVTYWIPVVVHVLHQYGPENISDAQVYDAIRILNEDFQKLNADISQVVASFQGITADCQVGFRLARKDPNGLCTNGIDRIASPETYNGDDGSKLNKWPSNKYLNIWTAANLNNGAAGYSYFPGAGGSNDGVMILHTYFGGIGTGNYQTARALTHEVGHWLNLYHTWGNGSIGTSCSGSDLVSDTPPTKGWQTCNLTGAVCNTNVVENVQNFMEYAYCDRMFTNGQKTRMTNALNSSVGGRNNLWKTTNLLATGTDGANYPVCAPKVDFIASTTTICSGSTITFTDLCWNGNPTTWSWSFPGGTPSTSPDSVPVIQYNAAGTFAVTLTATNSGGNGTLTKTAYVKVISSTAAYNNWMYLESYENASIPNVDWSIYNADAGQAWAQTSLAATTGTKSARLQNFSNSNDQTIDDLISPTIDLSAITNPTFTFKVAYAQKSSTTIDKLQVYLSSDCGQNWTQRYLKTGAALATAPITTASFTPNSTQWRQETVNLSGFTTFANVMFRFRFTSNLGNNIYLDDINILGPTGINGSNVFQRAIFVFPNPSNGSATVSFSLEAREKVSLKMYDVLGKEQLEIAAGDMDAGEHQLLVNTSSLSKGVYFLKLSTGDSFSTTRLMVE